MATNFTIFVDEERPDYLSTKANSASHANGSSSDNLPAKSICNDNLLPKREPLGLRQPLAQSQPEPASQATSSAQNVSLDYEDQENDISMASLGSDFVPSIINDNSHFEDQSFEVDEESGELSGNAGALTTSDDGGFTFDEDDLIDEDDDLDNDEDLQMELSQAFKEHDDSQLFKGTVYIDDIDTYLHRLERQPELRPLPNYMDFQNDIDSEKRAILINWLVEVSDEYNIQTETLFICTSIIDRFLSSMSVHTTNLQLLGIAAMFIASKYEEIYPPNLYQFVEITDETYSGKQICQMEQEILKTLDFRISAPTVTYFLNEIFAFNKFPKKVYHLAEYLCHLSLLADQPFLEYYPSEIAISAVILAAHQLDAKANISTHLKSALSQSIHDQMLRRQLPLTERLRDVDRRVYTLYGKLPYCIESLRALQERASSRSSRILNDSSIYHKYSLATYSSVSLLPAPKIEDLQSILE